MDDDDGFLEFDDFKRLNFIRFLINRTTKAEGKQTKLYPRTCSFEIITFINEEVTNIEIEYFWSRITQIISQAKSIYGFDEDLPHKDDSKALRSYSKVVRVHN